MISSRLFKALQQRGIQSMAPAQTSFVNTPMRFFAKKGEEEAADAAPAEEVEAAAAEPEPKPEPKPKAKAAPKAAAAPAAEPLDRALFQPFSVGQIKEIQSTPDHKPPSEEDTIPGRYSGVLFTTASQNGELFAVYEDIKYLQGLYQHSDQFRLFTENGGVGGKEIAELNAALKEIAPFTQTTLNFLTVLAENKRLNFIDEVAEKYAKLYQQFNKEEKITIISAAPLDADK